MTPTRERTQTSPFVFVTCQPGAEKFVKADVSRRHPDLRLAFSRPGFVTFKSTERSFGLDVDAPTVLARCFGPVFGPACRGDSAVEEACRRLEELVGGGPSVVHAFHRAGVPLGDEAEGEDPWAEDLELAERVASVCGGAVNRAAKPGELVVDVIETDPAMVWVGAHRAGGEHRPTPGGRPPRRQPPESAPSRVWQKIEEAIWWSGAAPGRGDVVLDIGCAPGGGTLALLDRGARVIGVDPGEMHSAVSSRAEFEHRPIAFEQVSPGSLPSDVNWLVYDVNLSPMLTLAALRKLCAALPNLRQGFLTLKLNKLEHIERLDWMLKQLRGGGFQQFRVTQLFFNRQELFVYARR